MTSELESLKQQEQKAQGMKFYLFILLNYFIYYY